jgi:enoyl-CoA hydratase/carnithine racemase
MAGERVTVEIADHVATVTLRRPEKHNALDAAMFKGIIDAVEQLKVEKGVRVVVLHGDGPSFCSGLDIPSFMAPDADAPVVNLLERPEGQPANVAQRVSTGWSELPMPVIAAVHGNCFGGGLQIALGADLRFAAPDAQLSVMESRWGLVPDMGISRSLPRLVGVDVAKELTFTARRLSGEEARQIGLVTRVAADPLAEALDFAREIAVRSPQAMRAAKRLFDETWNASAEESLLLETELQLALLGSPNQIEAVRAGMAKETPNFTDPE